MKFGVVYPQTEFGNDPAAIRDYAQTAEGLGYTHVVAYDHVLGANPDRPGGFSGPYTFRTPFQEVFVLLSFMAAITQKMELVSGIIILPQRQTVLAAKQAATLDVLSGGHFRLGVGLGWNEVEYTGLNENFHNRGRRIEEQLDVMRKLWKEPLVTYQGKWHTIPDAGLNPLPVRGSIPIWFGGQSEPALRRMARLADGWLINHRSVESARSNLDLVYRFLDEAGRARSQFGLEPRIPYGAGDPEAWEPVVRAWQMEGVTHLDLNTMGSGLQTPQEHIQAIRKFAKFLVMF